MHAHPILSQELLQIHVLQLEEASVAWKGPFPQQWPQEGRLGVGSQRTGSWGPSRPAGASVVDAQRVFIRVLRLVFVWRKRRKDISENSPMKLIVFDK